ncbi:hypothetical protein H5410_062958 [Solanum commersonii]|uniref:Reverse transcriptase n=1 Tax=Solanum commersonii TaxID=4109 RepID=A0A9J5WDV7_SOLCO|nr:hypothetical protein H5410_062958 [Solanum commersonii]
MGLHEDRSLAAFYLRWSHGVCYFADDIVLIDEAERVNARLEVWRQAESKGDVLDEAGWRSETCHHGSFLRKKVLSILDHVIQGLGDIGNDVTHRIGVAWRKWRFAWSLAALLYGRSVGAKRIRVQKMHIRGDEDVEMDVWAH